MFSLACGLAAFAALQLLVCAEIDLIEPGLRDPEYGRKVAFLETQLEQSPDRPLLLLVGSSRTAYGVRSDVLFSSQSNDSPLAYNFGMLGAGPAYELMYFRRLLNAGIRPRWVVFEIHPAFLNTAQELAVAHVPPFQRCDLRDMCALHDYFDDPAATWLQWLRYRVTACHTLRGELMRRFAERWTVPPTIADFWRLDLTTPDGWVPLSWPRPDEPTRKDRAAMCRRAYAPGYRDFEISDRSKQVLHEMLTICREQRIAATILLMPEAEEILDREVTLAQDKIRDYLSQLGEQYGAPLIDARRWCENADFGDGQHLMPDTATSLSRRLGREALAAWVGVPSQEDRDAGRAATIATRPQEGLRR